MNVLAIKTGNADLFELNTRVLMRRIGPGSTWTLVGGSALASRTPKHSGISVLELDAKRPARSALLLINHLRTQKPEIVTYGYDNRDGVALAPLDLLIALIPWNTVYIAHHLQIVEYKNHALFIFRAFLRLIRLAIYFLLGRKLAIEPYTLGFSDELLRPDKPVDFAFASAAPSCVCYTASDETRSASLLRSGEIISIKSEKFSDSDITLGFTNRSNSKTVETNSAKLRVDLVRNGTKELMIEQDCGSLLPGWNDHLIKLPKNAGTDRINDRLIECSLSGPCSELAVSFPSFINRKHKKKIVVIILDGINLDFLGIYNRASDFSKNIDHFFQDKLKYTRAYTQEIWTRPTFASMFTGYYPSHHQVVSKTFFSELPRHLPHLAEEMHKAGYHTVGYVSHGWANQLYGYSRGFDRFLWRQTGRQPTYNAKDITYFALETLQNNRDRDLFMFLHYFDTHFPFFPRSPYTYHRRTEDFRKAGQTYVSGKRNQYFSLEDRLLVETEAKNKIREIDVILEPLLLKLKTAEFQENTSVILTADHGFGCFEPYAFLENGFFRLTDETIHVPLLVSLSDNQSFRNASGEIDAPVEASIDLYASVMDLAGVEGVKSPYSRSYIPNKTGDVAAKPFVVSEALYFDSYQLTIRNLTDLYYFCCRREPNHYKMFPDLDRDELLLKNVKIPNDSTGGARLNSIETERYRKIREELGIAEYWRVPEPELSTLNAAKER